MTEQNNLKAILAKLKSLKNPKNIEGMERFGINPKNTYGINIPVLREMAKEIGKNHSLALELWESGIHEAKILASMIDDYKVVDEKQMEKWVRDFDSWDVCDQACSNLFDKTRFVYKKVDEWSKREEEFVKRAAFALIACLAVHDKKSDDEVFVKFFSVIKREARDERNFVRKAVNWALRNIGKRNLVLNQAAIIAAEEISKIDSKSAGWISCDALRELRSEAAQRMLMRRSRTR